MKKNMYATTKKKVSLAYILMLASFILCGCKFGNQNLNVHDYRFYIYLSEFNMPDDFIIEIQYYQNGNIVSTNFERPMNGRLFYADVPSNLQAIYLNIIKPGYGYYLKDYPVRKIHYDVVYDCHDQTYRFNKINYAKSLPLTCQQFADYILNNINPSSDSFAGGFNAYYQINSFFYSSIVDKENASSTFITDLDSGEKITVERRMNEIKEKASSTPKNNEFLILFILFTTFAIIIILPLLGLMMYLGGRQLLIWKKRR